jgi:uncharacterized protein (TIGR02588 family)
MAERKETKAREGRDAPEHTDWVERLATIVSALLILALLALLILDAVRTHAAAEFRTRVGEARVVGTDHYVEISVENIGDRAARDVEVTVTLTAADSTDEASFVVDWLPGKSTRHGVAILPRDPASGKVTATVKGFAEP